MEMGIKSGIHAMRLLWQKNSQEWYWFFLLIEARNFFNEGNWTAMLWGVQFEWPGGVQFIFNWYCHWATLVVRDAKGSGHFLHKN